MAESTNGNHFTSRNPSKRQKAGRVCNERNCETVLSVYNTEKYCSLHSEFKAPRTRGKTLY